MNGTVVVAIPLALILSLALIGYVGDRWVATAQPAVVCGDNIMQDQIRAGMYAALDDGFRQQVSSLFIVWMKDNRSQPARAKAGIDNSVAAYIHGYKAVENWKLPPC